MKYIIPTNKAFKSKETIVILPSSLTNTFVFLLIKIIYLLEVKTK